MSVLRSSDTTHDEDAVCMDNMAASHSKTMIGLRSANVSLRHCRL